MIPFNYTLAERSARYLAFLTAFDAPVTPRSAEDARSVELARILAFEPDKMVETIVLSSTLLSERDFAAGCQPGVAFEVDSLKTHFRTDHATMLSGCKLVGAMPFERKGKSIWADDRSVRFTLDAAAIERANAKASGCDGYAD